MFHNGWVCPTLYNACNCLSILWLKSILVRKCIPDDWLAFCELYFVFYCVWHLLSHHVTPIFAGLYIGKIWPQVLGWRYRQCNIPFKIVNWNWIFLFKWLKAAFLINWIEVKYIVVSDSECGYSIYKFVYIRVFCVHMCLHVCSSTYISIYNNIYGLVPVTWSKGTLRIIQIMVHNVQYMSIMCMIICCVVLLFIVCYLLFRCPCYHFFVYPGLIIMIYFQREPEYELTYLVIFLKRIYKEIFIVLCDVYTSFFH